MNQSQETSPLQHALADAVPFIKRVVFFSVFTSILVLTPSVYMLEVYGRVVNSRSHTTLFMLTILVVGVYILLEMLEWVRGQMMQQTARGVDKKLHAPVFHAIFAARLNGARGQASEALDDLRTFVEFLSSRTFLALIDAPLALFVLVLIYLIKPALGLCALGGAVVLFGIGMFNERRVRVPFKAANQSAVASLGYARGVIRNAQVIESMGMLDHIHKRWLKIQTDSVSSQAKASEYAGTNSALSKMVQSLQGSLILGFGAWFAIHGELTGGLMIVASILGGRVLAPLVQLIASWRQVLGARDAYARLKKLLEAFPEPAESMKLPSPEGRLTVEGLVAGPPQSRLQ
ncbi:MAG: type I secretion system permease/ATPase, partial [Candidatus Omnitrophica bacterium]|nr:type I secretion system permease/ATPase [Candidatus Omnitrophota bacterium]